MDVQPEAEALREARRRYWQQLLKRTNGSVAKAAQLAGRNRTHAHRIIEKLGIPRRKHAGNWKMFGL